MGKSGRSELHVVHVWIVIGEYLVSNLRSGLTNEQLGEHENLVHDLHRRWLDNMIGKMKIWSGKNKKKRARPAVHMLKGNPANKIPKLVNKLDVDLLVMGTVGRSGIPGLIMGNTAETIFNRIDCSVLAIKPDGFKSSIRLKD